MRNQKVEFIDIIEAGERIAPWINRTPVMTCSTLDGMVGAELYFKCENFQKAGAFKSRGAVNAVFSLSDKDASRGVATHSSGNHAAALARAAAARGIPAYIVMPGTAPDIKKEAVYGYGGKITFCEPTLQAREDELAKIVETTGASFIHPYDDPRVIAGQGTAAVEFLEDVPDLDLLVTPVGGGGLLSGTAIAARHIRPEAEVYGGEPVGADDAYRSFKKGELIPSVSPDTIADGLLTSLSERTFSIIRELVTDIVRVDDDSIRSAMMLVWERMKIIIEPSAAVPLAAVMGRGLDVEGRKAGIFFSGGNVSLEIDGCS
ncbi:MAG: pyridoxal-phosphate dependent enzyme [Bacteroidales bacterium]|nr:pyridoxal-phosphate dependent enzyme [Candidatus Latescibacterota bacterium]